MRLGRIIVGGTAVGFGACGLTVVGTAPGTAGAYDAPAGAVASTADDGALAPGSAYVAAVLADSPLAYWRLDESAGPIANDATGHNFVGTYSGDCKFGAPGALAGSPGVAFGKTCEIDVGGSFRFLGSSPYSIEAWVESDTGADGFHHVFTRQLRNGAPTAGYALLLSSPTTMYTERDGAGANHQSPPIALPAGAFAHLVAVYEGTNLRAFVNGTDTTSATDKSGMNDFTMNAFIGSTGTSNYFSGVIDEVALYDKALTAAQIAAHYAARSR